MCKGKLSLKRSFVEKSFKYQLTNLLKKQKSDQTTEKIKKSFFIKLNVKYFFFNQQNMYILQQHLKILIIQKIIHLIQTKCKSIKTKKIKNAKIIRTFLE